MKLILLSEFSGHLHRKKHRAWEDTYTSEERELILGSLSKAFPALQDLHSYILLLSTKGTTALHHTQPTDLLQAWTRSENFSPKMYRPLVATAGSSGASPRLHNSTCTKHARSCPTTCHAPQHLDSWSWNIQQSDTCLHPAQTW